MQKENPQTLKNLQNLFFPQPRLKKFNQLNHSKNVRMKIKKKERKKKYKVNPLKLFNNKLLFKGKREKERKNSIIINLITLNIEEEEKG